MIETLNFVNQYTIIIDIPGRNFKWKINIVVKGIVLQVRNLGKAKVWDQLWTFLSPDLLKNAWNDIKLWQPLDINMMHMIYDN